MGNVWAVLKAIAIALRDTFKSLPPVARHALAGFLVACLWSLDKRYHYIPDDLREPVMVVLAALGFGVVRQGAKQDSAAMEKKVDTVEHKLDFNTEATVATHKATDGMKDQLVQEVRTASFARGKEHERVRQENEDTEGE